MGESSAKSSSSSLSTWIVSLLVIAIAVIHGYPQPELQLEQDILPLAKQFAKSNNESHPLEGVNVVITGATSGIGLGLVKHFTGMGATVIAMGRSPKKLQALKDSIDNNIQLVTIQVQLGDLESVQRASQEIGNQFQNIDVLVNNAGIHYISGSGDDDKATPQGIDLSFGVNYVSHFLLTEKMMPLLHNSTHHPTIVQIASSYHFAVDGSELVVDNTDDHTSTTNNKQLPLVAVPGGFQGPFASQRAYANSKLAQLLHARALQRRQPKIRVKSVCPCWVGTSIAGDALGILLGQSAFPYDGFGIKSALIAALDVTRDVKQDWFTNSDITRHLMELMPGPFYHPWLYQSTPIRDMISQFLAVWVMLPFQKFVASVEARPSSPESYNETLQEKLYHWSYQMVSEYL